MQHDMPLHGPAQLQNALLESEQRIMAAVMTWQKVEDGLSAKLSTTRESVIKQCTIQ